MEDRDADGPYPSWFNDAEVCAGNSHGERPYSREDALFYIKNTAGDATRLVCAIILKKNEAHIGNISLQGIDHQTGSAELAIIIGDKSCWGLGLGEEACRAMIRHGFESMNLRRIHCGTFSNNLAMIALARRLGFHAEGIREKAVTKKGIALDVHLFGLDQTALAQA